MTVYAVIDTNVFVSSLISKNKSSPVTIVVAEMFKGTITPLYSTDILTEYREVLSRKKFNFSQNEVGSIIDTIERHGIYVSPSDTGIILPDMKDIPFYEVVMEKRDDDAYLVTGNIKHFPKEPYIVTPREMLDIIYKMYRED